MLVLTNRAAASAALNDPTLDVDVRALIHRRVRQVDAGRNSPPGGALKIVVVEGGDSSRAINDAVGFHITGDDAENPSYESIKDHGLWFEIAYVRDHERLFIFVENTPATELGIHYLCLASFWPDDDGDGQ